ARRPRARIDRERRIRKPRAATFAQLRPLPDLETRHERANRPDPERERIPPLVEVMELDARDERRLLDRVQAGCAEPLAPMAPARSREARLVLDVRLELAGGLPERAQRPRSSRVVPDARRHDASGPRDTAHLTDPGDRVAHEVDDELCERSVERRVVERQA